MYNQSITAITTNYYPIYMYNQSIPAITTNYYPIYIYNQNITVISGKIRTDIVTTFTKKIHQNNVPFFRIISTNDSKSNVVLSEHIVQVWTQGSDARATLTHANLIFSHPHLPKSSFFVILIYQKHHF